MTARFDVKFHEGQELIHAARDTKVRSACMGRRFGKTNLAIKEAIMDSLLFPGEIDPLAPQVVLMALPTLQQAIPLIWEPLVALAEGPLAPYVRRVDRVRHTLHFKGDKPPIRVRGANDRNGDGLRGCRIYSFKGDEIQDFLPGIFDTIVLPAMADTPGSTALLTFTPKGKLNHSYELFQRAETDPANYKSFQLPTLMNPFIPAEEVERFRATMPERLFRQEFEATFESFPARIYYELDSRNWVDRLPEKFLFTALGVDWGSVHPAVTCWGFHEGRWYHLESWCNDSGVAVPPDVHEAHIIRLALKYNSKATYCDPSQPSLILKLRQIGSDRGIRALAPDACIAGYNPISEGTTQVHEYVNAKTLLFPLQEYDNVRYPGRVTSKQLYEQMESYHWRTDRNGVIVDGTVAEGQHDHVLDGTRYLLARKLGG